MVKPYSYLDFKKWSLSNFSSIHVLQTQAFFSKQDVHSRSTSQWLQKVFRHLKKCIIITQYDENAYVNADAGDEKALLDFKCCNATST